MAPTCSIALNHNGFQLFLPCMFALFGTIPESHMTTSILPASDRIACEKLPRVGDSSTAILADRGSCTMSRKAHHAEAAGAKLLVIVHNVSGAEPVRMQSVDVQDHLLNIVAVMVSQAHGELFRDSHEYTMITVIHNQTGRSTREVSLKRDIRSKPWDPKPYRALAQHYSTHGHRGEAELLNRVTSMLSPDPRDLARAAGAYGTQLPALSFLQRAYQIQMETLTGQVVSAEESGHRRIDKSAQHFLLAQARQRQLMRELLKGSRKGSTDERTSSFFRPVQSRRNELSYSEYLDAVKRGQPIHFSNIQRQLPWTSEWSLERLREVCRDPTISIWKRAGDGDKQMVSKQQLSRYLKSSGWQENPIHGVPIMSMCLRFIGDFRLPGWFTADLLQTPDPCDPLELAWNYFGIENDFPELHVGGLNNTDGLKTAKFNMPLLLIVLEGKKRVSIFPETASVLLDPMRDGSRRMGSTNAPKEYNENDTTRLADSIESPWHGIDVAGGEMLFIPGGCPWEFVDLAERTSSVLVSIVDGPNLDRFRSAVYDKLESMTVEDMQHEFEKILSSETKPATLTDVYVQIDRFFTLVTSDFAQRPLMVRQQPPYNGISAFKRGDGAAWALGGFHVDEEEIPEAVVLDHAEFDEAAVTDAMRLNKMSRYGRWKMDMLNREAAKISPLEIMIAKTFSASRQLARTHSVPLEGQRFAEWTLHVFPEGESQLSDQEISLFGAGRSAAASIIFLTSGGGPAVIMDNRQTRPDVACDVLICDPAQGRSFTVGYNYSTVTILDGAKGPGPGHRVVIHVRWLAEDPATVPTLQEWVDTQLRSEAARRIVEVRNSQLLLLDSMFYQSVPDLGGDSSWVRPQYGVEERQMIFEDEQNFLLRQRDEHLCNGWTVKFRWTTEEARRMEMTCDSPSSDGR